MTNNMSLDLTYLAVNNKMLGDIALDIYLDLDMKYAMKFKELVQFDIVSQIHDLLKFSNVFVGDDRAII